MLIQNYDFRLPENLIAQEPVFPRDACRLMVLTRKSHAIEHDVFRHISDYLKPGDVLVFNQSKVIPARILFQNSGKECEILLVKQVSDDEWLAMVRPGRLFARGASFILKDGVTAYVEEVTREGFRKIRFSSDNFRDFLDKAGVAPLPPYISGGAALFNDYQTIYARHEGSVAAPTAGLHFTHRLLRRMQAMGVQLEFVTLHVGPGTFLPVKAKDVRDHTMHHEDFEIDHATAKRLTKAKHEGRRIIAVGTTAVRVLESAFGTEGFYSGKGSTNIYIYEGYKWKCIEGLITNFHLPKSTLLLLVSSFAGRSFIAEAYQEAIKRRYRFYSFGDAMFIF